MTDNIGGGGALAAMLLPPIVGGVVGGVLLRKSHPIIGLVGGVVAGFGATMLLARMSDAKNQAAVGAQNAKTLPAAGWSPLMPPSDAYILTSGSRFTVMGEVPPGVTEDALWARLATVGWTNIVGQKVANAKDPKDPNVMMYYFVGTWNGQANMPVPNDVSVTAAPAGM